MRGPGKHNKYRYFSGNAPYEFKTCPVCLEDSWIRVKSTYCSRECAHEAMRGENLFFKSSEYSSTHQILRRARGSACYCSNGCNANKYEWANLTGNYRSIWDYVQMCVPCHHRFDRYRVAVIHG